MRIVKTEHHFSLFMFILLLSFLITGCFGDSGSPTARQESIEQHTNIYDKALSMGKQGNWQGCLDVIKDVGDEKSEKISYLEKYARAQIEYAKDDEYSYKTALELLMVIPEDFEWEYQTPLKEFKKLAKDGYEQKQKVRIAEMVAAENERQKQEADEKRAAEEARIATEMYYPYRNDSYGYGIDLPKGFRVHSSTDKGVMLFSQDNSAMVFVGGNAKDYGWSNRDYYNDQLNSARSKGTVGYNVCGDDWFVVTWEKGSESFYVKQFTNRSNILVYIVQFPKSRMDFYSSLIEHMEDSFTRN